MIRHGKVQNNYNRRNSLYTWVFSFSFLLIPMYNALSFSFKETQAFHGQSYTKQKTVKIWVEKKSNSNWKRDISFCAVLFCQAAAHETPMGLGDRVVNCHPMVPTAWPINRAWNHCRNSPTMHHMVSELPRVLMGLIMKYHEGLCI